MAEEICKSPKVLLHIGYHKTGTTWFQSNLFSCQALGFHVWSAPRTSVHRIFCCPGPFSDPSKKLVESMIREATETVASGHIFVISHERLSGYPVSGGYDSRIIADRLKRYFPNARVFSQFREQKAMIYSMFRQQIVDGGALNLEMFLNPPQSEIRRVPMFDPDFYKYSKLFSYYRQIFGAENIFFSPYEAFLNDPGKILHTLGGFLDNMRLCESAPQLIREMARPNPSLSESVLRLQRWLNLLFVSNQMTPNSLVDFGDKNIRGVMRLVSRYLGSTLLSPLDNLLRDRDKAKVTEFCEGLYFEDNLKLSELLGIDLRHYGYSVGQNFC